MSARNFIFFKPNVPITGGCKPSGGLVGYALSENKYVPFFFFFPY